MSELIIIGVIAAVAWLSSQRAKFAGDNRIMPPPAPVSRPPERFGAPPIVGAAPAPLTSPVPRPIWRDPVMPTPASPGDAVPPPVAFPGGRPGGPPIFLGPPVHLMAPSQPAQPLAPPPSSPVQSVPAPIAAPPAAPMSAWQREVADLAAARAAQNAALNGNPGSDTQSEFAALLASRQAINAAAAAAAAGMGGAGAYPGINRDYVPPERARFGDTTVGAATHNGPTRAAAPMPWDGVPVRVVHPPVVPASVAATLRPLPFSPMRDPGGHIPPPPMPVDRGAYVKVTDWEGAIGAPRTLRGADVPAAPLDPMIGAHGPTVAPPAYRGAVHPFVQIAINWLRGPGGVR